MTSKSYSGRAGAHSQDQLEAQCQDFLDGLQDNPELTREGMHRAFAGYADDQSRGLEAWLDGEWPLWRNHANGPVVARLRRCWVAARQDAQAGLGEGGSDGTRRKAALWDEFQRTQQQAAIEPDDVPWKTLARSGKTIEAIKACRAAMGSGLAEARHCVEAYLRQGADGS